MGIARLLAKGWIIFCLFAGAHALHIALTRGLKLEASLPAIAICVILFAAMGLLFAGGFGVWKFGPTAAQPQSSALIPAPRAAVRTRLICRILGRTDGACGWCRW